MLIVSLLYSKYWRLEMMIWGLGEMLCIVQWPRDDRKVLCSLEAWYMINMLWYISIALSTAPVNRGPHQQYIWWW